MLRRRERVADGLGLAALLLLLLDYLPPSLLFLPTIPAGGDLPGHYATLVWLYERLLPQGRLHGWYPGTSLGHPVLLHDFPLPFLVMAAVAPLAGLAVAFKLGIALGVFLLPVLSYASLRLMGFAFPAPLLGAAAAVVFLFVEGGTLASTLSGGFASTYGIGLGVLFLGVVYRAYARGLRPGRPALGLAATALAHGYAVVWAGLSATYFLYAARRPWRTLGWLLGVAGLAFALAGVHLVPLVAEGRPAIPSAGSGSAISAGAVFPPLVRPLLAAAFLGLAATLVAARRMGGPDHRLLFLMHAALVAGALALAAPAFGLVDARLVPFAQLALCLAGGASIGLGLRRLPWPDVLALALVLGALVYASTRSPALKAWCRWSYTGLEQEEQWPAFRALAERLQGSWADPRVAVETSSPRFGEALPLFSGRATLELSAAGGLERLRLFNARDVVAVSSELESALAERATLVARIPPYALFRLPGEWRYVEPLPPKGAVVTETIEPERITITTDPPGHPLLVKVSYHRRWRAEGAEGPLLVAPSLMMVVPRATTVRLVYARTWADLAGVLLSLGGLIAVAVPKARAEPLRFAMTVPESEPRRWGGVIPGGILLLLVLSRLLG